MTPEQFAEEYAIKNAFIISYAGNVQPPFYDMAKLFSCLNNVKWSVIGDADLETNRILKRYIAEYADKQIG
ncbi:MAG: hypothetical protein IJQ28_03225 [Clostridia bacterium]|nr:hypothetical protein [Clostridia bacterium]